MKVLFDQGTPVPLRQALSGHNVSTAFEMGWAELSNGNLLDAAEAAFDVLVTTDQNLPYQQNFSGKRIAVLVLPTTSWPKLKAHAMTVRVAIEALEPGVIRRLALS